LRAPRMLRCTGSRIPRHTVGPFLECGDWQSPGTPPRALVCESRDWGESWTTELVSNYPMVQSKPNARILASGRMFVLSNLGPNRDIPVIAVGEPGELTVSRCYRLRPYASFTIPTITRSRCPAARKSCHDANYLTFHRAEQFRGLGAHGG